MNAPSRNAEEMAGGCAQKNSMLPKIIVVVGPTASGKSSLALSLAHTFDGEIVNADSRQLYSEMIIGTAMPTFDDAKTGAMMVETIPHHLYAIASPANPMTVTEYTEKADTITHEILEHSHIPLVVGGTGFYVQSIVDTIEFPHAPPNEVLRQQLEKLPLSKLQEMLKEKNPVAYARIDIKNPRRVMRALEIAEAGAGDWVRLEPRYDVLMLGVRREREVLFATIDTRVDQMMRDGLLEEVEMLSKKYGDAPTFDAIGYKELIRFLKNEITLEKAVEEIKQHTRDYAKRQLTWFSRDIRIHWVTTVEDAKKLVADFLQ